MEILSLSLAAGETKVFQKAGRYFEIIDASAAVSVTFYGDGGSISDNLNGALSGLYVADPYTGFAVSSATAQTVTLLLMESGTGGSRRQPGNVRIVDEVGAGCQNASTGIATAIAAFRVDTLLAAGASAAGATLRAVGASITSGAGGGFGQIRIVAGAAQPASFAASTSQVVLADVVSTNGALASVNLNDLHKKLPAGWGIWAMTSIQTVAATAAGAYASFE